LDGLLRQSGARIQDEPALALTQVVAVEFEHVREGPGEFVERSAADPAGSPIVLDEP
jgi:hypothetical protein